MYKVVKALAWAVVAVGLTAGAGVRTMAVTPNRSAHVVDSVSLAFGGDTAGTYALYVAYGKADAGGDITLWEKYEKVADVTSDTASHLYSTMPYGWGFRYHAMRFFLFDTAAPKPFDKQVAYLQGDEKNYVVTDFTPNGASAVEVDCELVDGGGTGLVCARSGAGYPFDMFVENSYKGSFLRFDYFGYVPGGVSLGRLHVAGRHRLRGDRQGLSLDGQLASKLSTPLTGNNAGSPMVLFAVQTGLSVSTLSKHKIYGLQAWSNATDAASLALNLVPCVKDGVPCFYDRVRKACLANSGSGTFSVGAEVPYLPPTATVTSAAITDVNALAVTATRTASGVTVSFPALPAACKLCMAYGRTDGGTDLDAWNTVTNLGTLTAGQTSYALAAMPAGWGDTAHYLRFFLLDESLAPFDRQVSYIQGTGANYIETGFTPQGRSSIRADIDISNTGAAQAICCGSTSGYTYQYLILYYGGQRYRWDYLKCDTVNLEANLPNPTGRHIVRTEANQFYMDDELVFSPTLDAHEIGSTLALFVQHNGGTNLRSFGTFKLHTFKAWLNRTIYDTYGYSILPALDLVPCVKNGKAYLFNRVTGTLLENKGTGDFAMGAETFYVDAAQVGVTAPLYAANGRTIAAQRSFANNVVSQIDLTFGPADSSYQLYAAFDAEDRGEDFAAWSQKQLVQTLAPADTALSFTAFPAGWGTQYKAVRFFLMDDSAPIMPYDARVEYIKASDTEYILTDFTPSGKSAVELDYYNPDYYQSTAFCARHAGGGNSFSLWIRGSFRFDYYASGCLYWPTDQSNDPSCLGRHVVRCDSTGLTMDGVRKIATQGAVATVSDHPMTLFAYNNMPKIVPQAHISLYSFKAWQDPSASSMPALDLIPCMKDKEPCLYNKTNGRLLRNQGTGAFEAGSVLANDLTKASVSPMIPSAPGGTVILVR